MVRILSLPLRRGLHVLGAPSDNRFLNDFALRGSRQGEAIGWSVIRELTRIDETTPPAASNASLFCLSATIVTLLDDLDVRGEQCHDARKGSFADCGNVLGVSIDLRADDFVDFDGF